MALTTTGYAVNDLFASIKDAWSEFRHVKNVRRHERAAYWRQWRLVRGRPRPVDLSQSFRELGGAVDYQRVEIDALASEVRGLESRFNGLVADFNGMCGQRRDEQAERTHFCPNGCNVFTTRDVNPECGACGTIMTTACQNDFEAAAEASWMGRPAAMQEVEDRIRQPDVNTD